MIDPRALEEVETVFKHFRKIGASHEQSASLTLAYAHLKATQEVDVGVDVGTLTSKPVFTQTNKPGKKRT